MSNFGVLISRNIRIGGQRTSMRLEPTLWEALDEIALREGLRVGEICDAARYRQAEDGSLTAAVRALIVEYFRSASTKEGHFRAGHGEFEPTSKPRRRKIKSDERSVLRDRL